MTFENQKFPSPSEKQSAQVDFVSLVKSIWWGLKAKYVHIQEDMRVDQVIAIESTDSSSLYF